MKKVVVPYEGAKNVTLFDEHYEVVDGEIEVSDEVAQRVRETPDLSHPGGGVQWTVKDIEPEPEPEPDLEEEEEDPSKINVGKGKPKK